MIISFSNNRFLSITVIVVLIGLFWFVSANGQSNSLPRSSPESEGVSSAGILRFIEAAEKSSAEFHSMMLVRNGKVIAEGWWNPYRRDLKHTMYSVTKSWTSTAVGFAVSENLLSVDARVIDFFPDQLPDTVSDYLKELKVRHLLSMTVGHDPDPTFNIVSNHDDWVKAFLERKIENQPGSTFLYNTMATYMLSAIIQKVTGQRVVEYLKPRLFEPLGITDVDSEIDPKGINTGGWGMRLRTEDMAKFGQLYLQKGIWNGRQILSDSWIEEATRAHIMQSPHVAQTVRDSSDWLQGYGYQFWRTRHNAYRADGAFGQFIVMLPEKNAVIVFTAETPDMQQQINLAWKYLLPAFGDEKLPDDPKSSPALRSRLNNLSLTVPQTKTSPLASKLSGKSILLEANDFGLEQIKIQFKGNGLDATMKTASGIYPLSFGSGKWAFGETKKHGPYLVSGARAKFEGLPPFKVAGAFSWKDQNTLVLTLRYIESPHTEYFTIRFDGKNVTMDVVHSFAPGFIATVLGKLE